MDIIIIIFNMYSVFCENYRQLNLAQNFYDRSLLLFLFLDSIFLLLLFFLYFGIFNILIFVLIVIVRS